jgi:HAD superfamily hydrolase (TIGR01509 family)
VRPELVIFDCDGVLVDSERLAVRIDVLVLTVMGWPITEAEVIERFVGRPDSHMRDEVSRYLGRELDDDWDAPFASMYRDTFERELVRVDGIVEALDALEAITLPTCVASSGTHEKMQWTLGLTGLYDRFEGRIFSTTEVQRGKPAPDLFLHAAARMRAAPSHCVVIEDSVSGVVAAVAAGMRVLAFAGGVTPRAALVRAGGEVFDDMRALPGLLTA